MNRRRFITVLAAGGTIALLEGCDTMPASAVAPWNGPKASLADVRLKALSWAMLAPNPHNLQSWLVDVRRPGELRFHVDLTRLLPATDPQSRQILAGCGAFLELFAIAMAGYGQGLEIETLPEGNYSDGAVDSRPFAVARLTPGQTPPVDDPIFQTISLRRSSKVAYTARLPGPAEFAALADAVGGPGVSFGFTSEPARVERLTELAVQGYRTEFATHAAAMESLRVSRIGADAIAAEPSGLAIHGTALWWGRKLGLVTNADLLDPQNPHVRAAIDAIVAEVRQTHAWGWLTTADNSRGAQISAGRAYLRLNLAATRLGLGVHPCSQDLQEFPEMRELYAALHRELGTSLPARGQMFFRIGYPDQSVPPTPRRPVDRILLT
jgi:nitroreductase